MFGLIVSTTMPTFVLLGLVSHFFLRPCSIVIYSYHDLAVYGEHACVRIRGAVPQGTKYEGGCQQPLNVRGRDTRELGY